MKLSVISKITLEGREFLVKRDDLIDPYLAGNKYRKLYTLLNTPAQDLKKIISYGGTQSNAMLAIAAMCKEKAWEFVYYTKPLASSMKENPEGNYAVALSLGMTHKEVSYELYREFIASLSILNEEGSFVLHQGGADESASLGLEVLASEIRAQKPDVKALATPSGTGTTALYLAKHLPEYIVYTIACVGDSTYLKEQMLSLGKIPSNLVILEPEKKYRFAKPYEEFLEIYLRLKEAGIEFDLLYAPLMWRTLLSSTEGKLLYIHSGGVTGNKSMLSRYKNK